MLLVSEIEVVTCPYDPFGGIFLSMSIAGTAVHTGGDDHTWVADVPADMTFPRAARQLVIEALHRCGHLDHAKVVWAEVALR
jgi:hypothetical protein